MGKRRHQPKLFGPEDRDGKVQVTARLEWTCDAGPHRSGAGSGRTDQPVSDRVAERRRYRLALRGNGVRSAETNRVIGIEPVCDPRERLRSSERSPHRRSPRPMTKRPTCRLPGLIPVRFAVAAEDVHIFDRVVIQRYRPPNFGRILGYGCHTVDRAMISRENNAVPVKRDN